MHHLEIQFNLLVAPADTPTILPILVNDTSDPYVCLKLFELSDEFVEVQSWKIEGALHIEVSLRVESEVHLKVFPLWLSIGISQFLDPLPTDFIVRFSEVKAPVVPLI